MILTRKVEEKPTELDLTALSGIDEQVVEINGQYITMTSLVPADVEKARKLVLTKKLEEGMVMEYLTFLAMRKAHSEITWYKFSQMNFKAIYKLMAVMATMNGFTEAFQVFGQPGSGAGTSDSEGGDTAELDFD